MDINLKISSRSITEFTRSTLVKNSNETVIVGGRNITIEEVVRVARHGAFVRLTDQDVVLQRVQASCSYIADAVESGQPIYGVTSGFGGMAHIVISRESADLLQNNLIWYHKTAAGQRLSLADVRAAMLLRAASHLHGASGIRLELIQRMEKFLNAGVTPHVYEFGSIGASGDLVPLSYITGALVGLDACYTVDFNGEEVDALSALSTGHRKRGTEIMLPWLDWVGNQRNSP